MLKNQLPNFFFIRVTDLRMVGNYFIFTNIDYLFYIIQIFFNLNRIRNVKDNFIKFIDREVVNKESEIQ